MEKINAEFPNQYLNPHLAAEQPKVKKKEKTKRGFSDRLRESGETAGFFAPEVHDSLEHLLDDVHIAGDELKKLPGRAAVLRYREAVSRFMKYVVDHGFETEQHVSGFNILKRKKFTVIRVVDDKLNRLAAGILQNQASQLQILEAVEEINGLLVDLMS